MSGLRSRSTNFFSWSWARTQQTTTAKTMETARDLPTVGRLPDTVCVCKANFQSQSGARRCREGVFVVFAGSPTDNARMAEHVYKKIEIVGSSPDGFEEAVQNALERARKTIRNMRWFEVSETRGYIEDGKIAPWQVTLKIGFTLDE